TGGGGGWGHPFDREPERGAADVRNGFVSRKSALSDYGVGLAEGAMSIDAAATAQHRANRPQAGRFHPPRHSAGPRLWQAAEQPPPRAIVGIDTGGTFTDVALLDQATGRIWTAKTPSTPDDPSRGFGSGIAEALAAAGLTGADIGRVLHGMTVATNLILEGKG